MFKQAGSYILSRILEGEKQVLTHDTYHDDAESIIANFTKKRDKKQKVLLEFENENGCIAKFLVTGIEYYPIIRIKRKNCSYIERWYMYVTELEDHFIFKKTTSSHGRLHLFLPPGHESEGQHYTYNSNLAGFFHIKGASTDVVPEFADHIHEQIYLKHKDKSKNDTLAFDCKPNCTNKNPTDDSGCGFVCGCETDVIPKRKTECPRGYESKIDILGEYQCVPKGNVGYMVGWIIAAIVSFILLLVLIYYVYMNEFI